jgi:hypothetical protein
MNKYYTYAYLREDGTPYYIGKGSNGRVYCNIGRTIPSPKDKNRILFLKQNLTEEEAFKHEKYMIAILGRKDLGTGILRNLTDGGEGTSGVVISEETRKKLSDVHKGKQYFKGKIHSKETRNKMSESRRAEGHHMYGKTHTEETKRRIGESSKGRIPSIETKNKMSEAHKGEKHYSYGKPLSEDHKRKLSEKFKSLIWITDGVSNKRISKLELIPSGFIRGRTIFSRKQKCKNYNDINNYNISGL